MTIGEIFIQASTNSLNFVKSDGSTVQLLGIAIPGEYSSEPNGSLFIRSADPSLVYKVNGTAYKLVGVSIGSTTEPSGSLWINNSSGKLCFAYNGTAYQIL